MYINLTILIYQSLGMYINLTILIYQSRGMYININVDAVATQHRVILVPPRTNDTELKALLQAWFVCMDERNQRF